MVNMGLAWTSDLLTIQRMYSSAGLVAPSSIKLLPRLPSGAEATVRFGFLVPSAKTTTNGGVDSAANACDPLLESVWRFYAGSEPFGPMLRFRFVPKYDNVEERQKEREEILVQQEKQVQKEELVVQQEEEVQKEVVVVQQKQVVLTEKVVHLEKMAVRQEKDLHKEEEAEMLQQKRDKKDNDVHAEDRLEKSGDQLENSEDLLQQKAEIEPEKSEDQPEKSENQPKKCEDQLEKKAEEKIEEAR
jgi:hypothetical protein